MPQSSGEARLAALDAAIARGLADADAGRAAPADQAFDQLERQLPRAIGRTWVNDAFNAAGNSQVSLAFMPQKGGFA